ncbi:MAG: aminodeoxychorismate synthase, component I [Rhodospirillaceae bacterium]|nr:MAG: aminodeoxychorismate synthase, component I [Rhodospirillaceae bacterium]
MDANRLFERRPSPPCIVQRTLPGRHDLLGLHARKPARYPFLLESAVQGGPRARYDILFAFPGASLTLAQSGSLAGGFLHALDRAWQAERTPRDATPLLPFTGGWFLYLGYELASEIEPTLRLPAPEDDFPVACATRIPAAILYDTERNETHLMAESGQAALLDALEADVLEGRANAPTHHPASTNRHPLLAAPLFEERAGRYLDHVQRIKDYIAAGDIFQANLSRLWQGRLLDGTSNNEIYARLREQNPAPFAGLVSFGERSILSSSPERLVERRGSLLQTRPIAGTRPRGKDDASDRGQTQNLLANPKERAEHIMLIDLERNDLGRVTLPGSLAVDEFMSIETYAHVHHIVSNVCGRVAPETTPGDIIRAVFPGGTITGCPKVRCMEIIAELEGTGRGPYTGAIGYLNRDGDMDLNILIRSILCEGNRVSIRAGAGIVADSVPERELEETRDKARGMVRALTQ